MELSFFTLDVFTSTRFEGNPLAVVAIPSALKGEVSQDTKQNIAKEFNLSETVFLHEPENAQPKEVNIDIFTVESELPFAGHPTIGTAVLVKHHLYPSVETLVAKCGSIQLSTGTGRTMKTKIPHDVHLHSKTLVDAIPTDQQRNYPGLSHNEPVIREAELEAPVFSIVKGMTFLLVKLPSLDLLGKVERLRLDFDGLDTLLLDADWAPSFAARYYYVDEADASGLLESDTRSMRTRMVEMGFEDPATGSAASALAAYLTTVEKSKVRTFVMTQGVEMGRRSVINVETSTEENGGARVKMRDLSLGGEAVVVKKGTLLVD